MVNWATPDDLSPCHPGASTMPAVRRARDGLCGDQGGRTPTDDSAVQGGAAGGLRHRRRSMSPGGLAILSATVLALALRLFLVSRAGFLTSGTVEYDDGVYLGAAMRLLHGALPYKDYAFVQPPGIVVVALPGALVGTLTSQATGLAAARWPGGWCGTAGPSPWRWPPGCWRSARPTCCRPGRCCSSPG